MHPVIRVLVFIIFSLHASRLDLSEFFVAVLILLLLALICQGLNGPIAWSFLKRLRWLFLSILILYAWFTPGQALFDLPQTRFMPTYEGLQAGLLQVSSLILIVLALVILVSGLARERLLAAIYWLSRPVGLLGISREHLVVRLVLAMAYVPRLQMHLGEVMTRSAQAEVKGLRRIAAVAGNLFAEVQQRAEQAENEEVAIATLPPPSFVQWLYPLFVMALFVLLHRLATALLAGMA